MNDALPSGMREASRLARAGRLAEATALLQRVLHNGRDPYCAPASEEVPHTIDLVPDTVDVTKLVKPAADAGIAFNPGPEWACDPATSKAHLRLCFALPSHDEIRAGVAAFARVCFEQTGIPAQSANVRHARQ